MEVQNLRAEHLRIYATCENSEHQVKSLSRDNERLQKQVQSSFGVGDQQLKHQLETIITEQRHAHDMSAQKMKTEIDYLREQMISLQDVVNRKSDPAVAAAVAQTGSYLEKVRVLAGLSPATDPRGGGGGGGNPAGNGGSYPLGGDRPGRPPARLKNISVY